MRKISKLTKVATAVGVALACISSGASASAMAQADINVINFILTKGGTAFTPLDVTDFSQLSILDSLTNTAVLNPGGSAFQPASASQPPFVGSVDALQASVGANPHGQNDYTADATPPTATFARGDSILTGQAISGTPFTTGHTANTVAETEITSTANGNSLGSIEDTTTFTFVLAHAIGDLGVTFDASTFLQAWTSPGSLPGTSAGASLTWFIKISDANGTLIEWAPNGVVGTGTETGIKVLTEGCNLNTNTSATFNEQKPLSTCNGGFSGTSLVALAADTPYSFQVTQTVKSQAAAIPEPATLTLLGIALAGMGFGSRRRSA